jgi:chromosome segregation ATPase
MSKSSLELDELRQKFSTKESEIESLRQKFSTITTENENIFQNRMSKKVEELDELRHSLDELKQKTDKPDNTNKLQDTLQKIRQQVIDRDVEISELKSKINELNKLQQDQKALYLKGSNLDNKLYK